MQKMSLQHSLEERVAESCVPKWTLNTTKLKQIVAPAKYALLGTALLPYLFIDAPTLPLSLILSQPEVLPDVGYPLARGVPRFIYGGLAFGAYIILNKIHKPFKQGLQRGRVKHFSLFQKIMTSPELISFPVGFLAAGIQLGTVAALQTCLADPSYGVFSPPYAGFFSYALTDITLKTLTFSTFHFSQNKRENITAAETLASRLKINDALEHAMMFLIESKLVLQCIS